MCGIVGYIGNKKAQPIVLDCLGKLEYRGYDSCGIALCDGSVKVYKDIVRVAKLKEQAPVFSDTIGIGHTRWATHGIPSEMNAHPHSDCTGSIAVVHNGIISNYQSLRKQLTEEGHTFTSDTDTEVLAHLVEKYYSDDLPEAVERALQDVQGSYAIAVLAANQPLMVVARKDSPLVIGVGDRENFIASDVPAILEYTDRVIYLEEGELGIITADTITIRKDGRELIREQHKIHWTAEQAQKGGFEHFMLKEINEQPQVIRDTLMGWVNDYQRLDNRMNELRIPDYGPVQILACGTSYHSGLIGRYCLEQLVGIPATVELASEYNYYHQTLTGRGAIAVSQSGETADTIKAVRKLQEAGSYVLAVTNVQGSTISRIADETIYTYAGPEISVAATKSFMAQLMVFYSLAMSYSNLDSRRLDDLKIEFRNLPQKVSQVLDYQDEIQAAARQMAGYENAFFIGRGINYPIALEGALKLKEISYIHAEGYSAGEIKHGPFALLTERTPVVAIVSPDSTYEAILSNIREIKARLSPVIALVDEEDTRVEDIADSLIRIPKIDYLLSPIVNTVVLQLLAYYAACERGCTVDFPRNLAKSVTVE